MIVAAALAGGACGPASPACLRLCVGINEAVTTLLLNYVALDLMLFLIYDPWKDPPAPASRRPAPLPGRRAAAVARRQPGPPGVVIAVVATARGRGPGAARTAWGFQLRVVGGNPEAARRAGLRVGLLLLSAPCSSAAPWPASAALSSSPAPSSSCGPASALTYGYIGFLASWLARHKPIQVAVAAVLPVRHRDRRRQPADRLRPAGRHREHPDGAGAAGRLRLGQPELRTGTASA